MNTHTTDDGWYFEGPDYEVGLLGILIVHEGCDSRMGDDELPDNTNEGVSDDGTTFAEKNGVVTATTTYRCICGAKTTLQESYPADDFAEPGRES